MPEFRIVGSRDLGMCPAQVWRNTGLIDINRDVWNRYTPFQQKFIIEHERGHYILQTDSEHEADAYALNRLYATEPQSLKKSLRTLDAIPLITADRKQALYRAALQLDAQENHNQRAIIELTKQHQPMTNKRTSGNDPFLRRNNSRADGVTEVQSETNQTPQINMPSLVLISGQDGYRGIRIGRWHISFETLLLAAILFVLIRKA